MIPYNPADYSPRSPASAVSRMKSRRRFRSRSRHGAAAGREYIQYSTDSEDRGYNNYKANYEDTIYYDYDSESDYSDDDSDSSLVRVRQRLTRAERYRKPINVIEVDLQNIAEGSTFDAKAPAREATEHRLDRMTQIRQRHHFEPVEWRKILSVRRYVNQDARETALVQCQMSTAGGGRGDFEFQWIHVKAEHPKLRDFQNFVATLDSVDPDERSLAAILLKKAVEEHEQTQPWGKFLEGRVDRCDGHKGSEPDKWAIFLSIHHLHAAPQERSQSVDPDAHHSRTLFEYHYNDQDNAAELDAKQTLRQASQSDEILHVHNMWLLLLSSGTLITSSPDTVDDCLRPALVIEDITSQSAKGGLQIIRFLDPTDRQLFVPSAHCETWFAMMDKVVGLCGSTYGVAPEKYHINDVNGVEITASEWQRFLASQDSFCATVRISLASTAPPPPPQLSAGSRRGSLTNSLRNDRRDLVPHHRDDESPSHRRPRRRARRDSSRDWDRDEAKARQRKEDREREEARIEKKNQEIEREVASVLQSDQPAAIAALGDGPENADTPTSPIQTNTGEQEPQQFYFPERTESPGPLDTTVHKSPTHRSRTRTPPGRRSTRRTTADSFPPAPRRTRTSTHMDDSERRRRENALALVLYGTKGASRLREPGTISRKSTIARDRRNTPPPRTDLIVDADRDRNQLALVRRDMRSSEERERSIKRRREKPVYRVDFLPHIITNAPLHVKKFDHVFYLPEEVFNAAGRAPVVENQGSNVVTEKGSGERTSTSASGEHVADSSSHETKMEERVDADTAAQQPPEPPPWKAGAEKGLPPLSPPPPVFLWQTGNMKHQNSHSRGDADSKENHTPPAFPHTAKYGSPQNKNTVQESQDWQVLNLILSQIDLTLSRGDRISGDAVQELKEKEGPIYKHLQVSSMDAVQAAYAQLCGVDGAPPAGHDPASWDIAGRIGLCLEILKELMEFFLPRGYPSIVLQKFWGGVALCIEQLQQMLSAESGPGSRYLGQGGRSDFSLDAFYVVNAELAPRKPQDPALKLPDRSLEGCPDCIRRRPHQDMDSAVVHLHQIHFQGTELTSEELQRWIRRGDKVDSFQLQCDAKRLLDTVLDHCTHLRTLKDEVIAGVCGSGKFDSAVYRLPNGLVRAFERILTMMAYSGYAASLSVREYHESPERFRRFFASTHQNHIVDLGYGAEAAFDEAKSNLMLMSRVQEYSNSIQFDTVGPEYMVLVLLAGLKDRGVNQPLNLAQLHRKELNRLTFEVHHHPRRRLLQEIRTLETEVLAVSAVREGCQRIVDDYSGMLASRGFKKTTSTRRKLYRDFEERLAKRISKGDRQEEREADNLLAEIPDLCRQLTQAVEIQQEDHGKAILVFTVVTIIFLPMSFVTGFMGMNTVDIRNLHSGQWVFWAAAVPLTVVVVGVTIWIGYKGELLSRWLWLRRTDRSRRRQRTSSPIVSSNAGRRERDRLVGYQSSNEKVNHTTNATTTTTTTTTRANQATRPTRLSAATKVPVEKLAAMATIGLPPPPGVSRSGRAKVTPRRASAQSDAYYDV